MAAFFASIILATTLKASLLIKQKMQKIVLNVKIFFSGKFVLSTTNLIGYGS